MVGNGLKEFGDIPPANLVEVLQMEVKMAVNAKAYLVSGYPRGMRDVVEWTSGVSPTTFSFFVISGESIY